MEIQFRIYFFCEGDKFIYFIGYTLRLSRRLFLLLFVNFIIYKISLHEKSFSGRFNVVQCMVYFFIDLRECIFQYNL